MVVELGERGPEVAVARRANLEAEIHVVERHRQRVLVQAADLLVDRLADHEAGGGDGGIVLHQPGAIEPALGPAGKIPEGVSGHSADAENDAGVLDRVVGVIEHGPDAANLRPQGMAGHFFQPIRRDDLEVVVEQGDHVARRLLHREIVNRGIVERRVVFQHARRMPRGQQRVQAVGQRGEEGQRRRLIRAVVDEQDLKPRISRVLEEALDAALDQRDAIARGDDDRDEGWIRPAGDI